MPESEGSLGDAIGRGGELRDRAREGVFRAETLAVALWQARLFLGVAAVVNLAFLASDMRYAGTPHLVPAVSARLAVVAASIAALGALAHRPDPRRLDRVLAGWLLVAPPAVGVLITSGTPVALLTVLLLPSICYLALPVAFPLLLAGGLWATAAALTGYFAGRPEHRDLALAMVLLLALANAALAITMARRNAIERRQWLAIAEARRAQANAASTRDALGTVLTGLPAAVVVARVADGRVVQLNPAAAALLRPDESRPIALSALVAEGEAPVLLGQLRGDGPIERELALRSGDGRLIPALVAASRVELEGEACIILSMVDITARKALETRLEDLASTDPLTGLPNRLRFFAVAEAEVRRSRRSGKPLAVLMVDLDHFKAVNDRYGHDVGDATLRSFARVARATVRDQDTIARLGGEEFACLLPETDRAGALVLAERLRRAVEGATAVEKLDVRLTISIGVSALDPGEAGLDAALKRADVALYAAKRAGRNRIVADAA